MLVLERQIGRREDILGWEETQAFLLEGCPSTLCGIAGAQRKKRGRPGEPGASFFSGYRTTAGMPPSCAGHPERKGLYFPPSDDIFPATELPLEDEHGRSRFPQST